MKDKKSNETRLSKTTGRGTYNNLLNRIAEILNQARTKVIREINKAQVLAYWEIGREIVEFEQRGKARAPFGNLSFGGVYPSKGYVQTGQTRVYSELYLFYMEKHKAGADRVSFRAHHF